MRDRQTALFGAFALALLAASGWCGEQKAPPPGKQGGMLMGPPVSMIRNVPLGRELDVVQAGGMAFSVFNRGSDTMEFNLQACKPLDAGSTTWERGYEPIPDTSWFRLDPAVISLPSQQAGKVKLFINVPNKPEYANRKFMLCILTRPGSRPGFGAGLALCARVMLETDVRSDTDGANAGPIAVTPDVVCFSGIQPGANLAGKFALRNNTAQEQTYALGRYQQAYKDNFRDERQRRYLSTGFQFVPAEGWAKAEKETYTLKAGEAIEVHLAATVPATATPGGKYEELIFIGDKKTMDEAAVETDGKMSQTQLPMTFVRVQYEVAK